jgi:hypothetical protein
MKNILLCSSLLCVPILRGMEQTEQPQQPKTKEPSSFVGASTPFPEHSEDAAHKEQNPTSTHKPSDLILLPSASTIAVRLYELDLGHFVTKTNIDTRLGGHTYTREKIESEVHKAVIHYASSEGTEEKPTIDALMATFTLVKMGEDLPSLTNKILSNLVED